MADEGKDVKGNGDHSPEKRRSSADPAPPVPDVELLVDGFGFMPSELKPSAEEAAGSPCGSSSNINVVRRYTWRTKNRMTVQLISYGATITKISVPDRKGVPDDVVAGFDTLEEYFQKRNPYFGAILGRYANIIKDGTFTLRPGRTFMLSTNKDHDHFNGGHIGFDKVNWRSYVSGNKVVMSHVSDSFHEGYPGTVMAHVTFEVTCDNIIKICMKCTTSEPTIINLSNALYFNLGGHHTGSDTMCDHIFTINGDKYTKTDEEGYITGEKKVVGGTPLDFRVPRMLKTMLPKIPMGGYDVNYCITQGTDQDLSFHARALHPFSGRVLEVYSNQPGVQFYTGNQLPDPDKIVEQFDEGHDEEHEDVMDDKNDGVESEATDEENGEALEEASQGKVSYGYVPLVGKQGTNYKKHGLFCFMPQNYPDACNRHIVLGKVRINFILWSLDHSGAWRANSPLSRTLAGLNILLDANPDCDLFADEWKDILLACLNSCEIDV